jgi:hypothetical protein
VDGLDGIEPESWIKVNCISSASETGIIVPDAPLGVCKINLIQTFDWLP